MRCSAEAAERESGTESPDWDTSADSSLSQLVQIMGCSGLNYIGKFFKK